VNGIDSDQIKQENQGRRTPSFSEVIRASSNYERTVKVASKADESLATRLASHISCKQCQPTAYLAARPIKPHNVRDISRGSKEPPHVGSDFVPGLRSEA
jgi:hypothetical protein